ncbi:hypothetical protein EV644_102621 [Kribbella orskensis]|uniref:Carbon-nitrogen hydrolase n=1 Tax=Kribbella orskensis TaxID=2512216 RepID=A0ABY2BT52_9ACTN|nr:MULTISPECIES: hypothetical protein [Kribbella]TCN42744.1 hypothetical protein EV642_102116 [Kribbella sp. VKM Ac-2500]TCO29900.1 hypothetical protein EV644_102621 [Kribbella orskensis]
MTSLRVAAAQIRTGADPVANLAIATDAVRRAAAGAELVALPEATLAAFGTDLRAVAEPLDGSRPPTESSTCTTPSGRASPTWLPLARSW